MSDALTFELKLQYVDRRKNIQGNRYLFVYYIFLNIRIILEHTYISTK